MLALKKKREAEAKAKAEAAAQAPPDSQPSSEPKVSLLGIGGKKKKDKSEGKSGGKKRTPGEIRIQKGKSLLSNLMIILPNTHQSFVTHFCTDIADLDGGKVATIDFPNPNDLTKFFVLVSPDTGYWKGAKYEFEFAIPDHYVSNYSLGISCFLLYWISH